MSVSFKKNLITLTQAPIDQEDRELFSKCTAAAGKKVDVVGNDYIADHYRSICLMTIFIHSNKLPLSLSLSLICDLGL